MISALDRKLLRDLKSMHTQVLAIALVMAAGIAMFVMALSALDSLTRSRDAYYQRYRFAQLFASLKRAPLHVAQRIAELEGVQQVDPRVVASVSLDLSGMNEPAIGRLISIPDGGTPRLNGLYLRRGRWIDTGRGQEVLVAETFAAAHRLVPGDTVRAVINGRLQGLTIVGTVLSPEYVIQIQPGNLLPDHRRFGIFWMGRQPLEAAFDMKGAFNDLSLTLTPGADERAVIDEVDRLLAPYGGVGAYGRGQQTSHQYLSDEIRQLSTMALVAPSIFLAVAAFLLNVVLARLIGLQREQIAALKAFGYGRTAIGVHYLKLVVVISLIGTALGVWAGEWMGNNLTRLYAEFYQFPTFFIRADWRIVVAAIAISVSAAAAGALVSVWRAVRLQPAAAMRPQAPPRFNRTLLERLGMTAWLPQATRMTLRQLARRPVRVATALFGTAMAVAILVLGSFSLDAVQYIMHFQFRLTQRQDLTVTLFEPASQSSVHALARLEGVQRVQPFRAVATRIRHAHRSRRIALIGLQPGDTLYRVLDVRERPVPLPADGLIVSDKLAELLSLHLGDEVVVDVLEGERPTLSATVTAIVAEYGGLNAYMPLESLHRWLGESPVVSGAYLAIDPARQEALYAELKRTPRVAGVIIKESALRSFSDTIAKNLLTMRAFNILFSVIIAFGVVYNNARISLSEQSRELATLRVIGFTRGEVSWILLGELLLLTLGGIPLGWLIGYGLAAWFVQGLDTEAFRIPLVIEPRTFALAAAVVALAALISGGVVRRRIDTLDLVGVLKTRE